MKPTVLHPMSSFSNRISSFWDVFCSDEVYVCKDKPHSFISPGSFLPQTSPFSCIFQPVLLGRCVCTLTPSSTILQNPDVVEEPMTTGCWAQVASITDAHNYRGKEQGWAERAKHKHCLDHRRRRRGRAGKSNVTIPPNRCRVILGSR